MSEFIFDLQRFENIYNYNNNTLVSGTGLADSIYNSGNYCTINTGAGNDSIENWGNNSNVNGQDGNDTIVTANSTSNVTLVGGDGDDYIQDIGERSVIFGDKGNDSIELYIGMYASSKYATIMYSKGDGNDTISNFGSWNTLSISGGSYSTTKSGSDIIVTVGEERITLVGAANLDSVNIDGEYKNPLLIFGTNGDDYIARSLAGATIDALGGDDWVIAGNDSISINGSAGNDLIYNGGEGHKDGYTVKYTSGNNVTLAGGTGDDYILNYGGYNVSIDGGTGNDSVENYGFRSTISGDAGDDTISNKGNDVKIDAGAGNDSIISGGYDYDSRSGVGLNVTIDAGDGDDFVHISYYANDVTINGGAGNDTIENGQDIELSAANLLFTYNSGDGNDLITGFNETSTLKIGGGTGTYSTQKSGEDVIVTVGDGEITLAGAANLSSVNISGKETNYWTLDGTTATYGTSNETLITISGVKSLSGISLSGKTVTLSNSSLNKKAVTISDGYTLKLASDVSISETTPAGWTLSGTNATYKSASTTAGYTLADNQISYTAASGGETLVTVNGVKSVDGLVFDSSNKEVIVGNESLNQETVTISDGYTLKLASDISTPEKIEEGWGEVSSGKATYNFESTTEGYTLADNKISYTAATTAKSFTVNGIKSTNGIAINGTTITLKAANLNKKAVTISDGYTLKLASDVSAPATKNAWSLNKTTATYNQTTSAGYTLADNAITYSKKSTKALVTVKGVKSLDGLLLKKKVVTVSKASLGTSKVTINGDGYTLKLASDVSAPVTKNAWSLKKTTATYNQTTSAGYKLANNTIAYSKAATKTLATVSGVKSLDGLSLKKKVVTISKASLGTSKVTISDGYTLKLGSDVTKAATKKAAFSLNGSTATYKSSYKTAGYTLASNSKSISYSKATTASSLATIKGAKSAKGLSISGKKITLKNSALKNNVTVSGGYEFNFASDYKSATITGSAKADTITANGSKLSINGGAGNDTIKVFGNSNTVTGGKGSDVFIFKAGKSGVIADYAAEDKISIASGTAKVTTSGSDLIFTVGKGKITVTGGKDKTVSYIDSGGEKTYTYSDSSNIKYNKAKTAATLLASYRPDEFNFIEGLQTLDASKVTHDLTIIGNKEANSIVGSSQGDTIEGGAGADIIRGGKGNDSLFGGAGNDSLYGGEDSDTLWGGIGDDYLEGGKGSDIFVFGSNEGTDEIYGYEQGLDKIMILSNEQPILEGTPLENDVTFNIGKGKITVLDGANKTIEFLKSNGENLKPYIPSK